MELTGGGAWNQTGWDAGFGEGAGGVVYGGGADRSTVSGAGAGTGARSERDVRAGRADGVAYASAGQTLVVTAGCGWLSGWAAGEEIRPGDVVWFAPGEKHWHGATRTTGMTHIAVQESWMARLWSGWSR